MKIRPERGVFSVQVGPDNRVVLASAELIFLLSSVGSVKTYMLQTAAN